MAFSYDGGVTRKDVRMWRRCVGAAGYRYRYLSLHSFDARADVHADKDGGWLIVPCVVLCRNN